MKQDLEKLWRQEEAAAKIKGWDFSHVDGRCCETLPSWSYEEMAKSLLTPSTRLLDMDTGGGEKLLKLGHDPKKTTVTEAYPPNAELCRNTLSPLGIRVVEVSGEGKLPFEDGSFDLVLNRHGSYTPGEIHRILSCGGVFLTQQVGEENDSELSYLLIDGFEKKYSGWNLSNARKDLEEAGFDILQAKEEMNPIAFGDVGALVWFARIIEWEFPDFSVDKCLKNLWKAQEILEETGKIEAKTHRFLLMAKKK